MEMKRFWKVKMALLIIPMLIAVMVGCLAAVIVWGFKEGWNEFTE